MISFFTMEWTLLLLLITCFKESTGNAFFTATTRINFNKNDLFLNKTPEVKIPWLFHGRHLGGMLRTPSIKQNLKLPDEQWFDQRLDHFTAVNSLWQQRYFMDKTYYKPGGPVFLMISGEGPISSNWMVTGQWIKFAKTYNALCFMLEHRFYGKSHPTRDVGVNSLQYLSSKQALADLAYFRTNMTESFQLGDAKWIAFGGSYAGALAAWFRYKYPHLVNGAVASSAPIEAKFDFQEYLDIVGYGYGNFSKDCLNNIQTGMYSIASYLIIEEKRALLKQMFQLCSDINPQNGKDIMNFYEMIADIFASSVQYDNPSNNIQEKLTQNINGICNIMTNASIGTQIQRIATIVIAANQFNSAKCFDFAYSNLIGSLSNTYWDQPGTEGARQWFYQTCTEFSYFQTSSSPQQPFGDFFPLRFFTQMCRDVFSQAYDDNFISMVVNDTNIMNGGISPLVSNIVLPNGSKDPWHALSPIANLSSSATAIFIKGTSHCADMYSDSITDPPQLIEARKQIEVLLKSWL